MVKYNILGEIRRIRFFGFFFIVEFFRSLFFVFEYVGYKIWLGDFLGGLFCNILFLRYKLVY